MSRNYQIYLKRARANWYNYAKYIKATPLQLNISVMVCMLLYWNVLHCFSCYYFCTCVWMLILFAIFTNFKFHHSITCTCQCCLICAAIYFLIWKGLKHLQNVLVPFISQDGHWQGAMRTNQCVPIGKHRMIPWPPSRCRYDISRNKNKNM